MSLRATAQRLIELQGRPTGAEAWPPAREAFLASLRAATDAQVIVALLDEDVEDQLPISAKTAAFERVLELGLRTPHVLRQFAAHLWFHGPASDDRAAQLKAEADRLEQLASQ